MTTEAFVDKRHNHCGSSCAIELWKWDVPKLIMQHPVPKENYAVLILNRQITQYPSFLKKLWNNATIRMTVDGGTRQWDKFLSSLPEYMMKSMKLPDMVTGDFDSITEEILEKYKKKGCKIILTPDQNYTDFTKALMELNIHSHAIGTEMEHVMVLCQSCGRMDQVLGNIQTLFLAKTKRLVDPNTMVYLLADDSLSWLLSPGEHVITIPESTRENRRAWCSLVPIGETCQYVTSSGLKWNLDHQPLKFGDLVSTSNAFDGSEIVKIRCSHTLLWSMRVPCVMHP